MYSKAQITCQQSLTKGGFKMEMKRKTSKLTALALVMALVLALVPAMPVHASGDGYLINDAFFDWSVSYSFSTEAVTGYMIDYWGDRVTTKTVEVGSTLTINVSATNPERPIGFEIELISFELEDGEYVAVPTILAEHALLWSDIEQNPDYAMFRYEPLPRAEQTAFDAQVVNHVFDAPGEFWIYVFYFDGWQNAIGAEVAVIVTGDVDTSTPTTPTDTRTLRFAIGETSFTDNNTTRTLEAAPFIQNDRTMVPLGVIVQALGATNVNFDNPTQVVSFTVDGVDFALTIGEALPDGMGTPVLVQSRTFVPLAYISLAIGAQVRWDSANRAAYVYI